MNQDRGQNGTACTVSRASQESGVSAEVRARWTTSSLPTPAPHQHDAAHSPGREACNPNSMTKLSGHAQLFSAGVAGTAAMMAVSKWMGSPVMEDLQELAATATAPRGSRAGEAAGLALQLLNGGLFAQAYGAAIDAIQPRAAWCAGATIGAAHGVLAGAFLGAVPAVHPRVPEQVPTPRAFLLRRGVPAALALVALHALYGAIVGEWAARRHRDTAMSSASAQTPRR